MRASILVLIGLVVACTAQTDSSNNVVQLALGQLKQVAQLIEAGKSPQEIVQAALLNQPAVQQVFQTICKNQLIHKIQFVDTVCNFITNNAAAVAQIPQTPNNGLQKREFQNDFGSIAANAIGKVLFAPLALYGNLLVGALGAGR